MLTLTGHCCSRERAVEFLEMLPENIPEEIRDEEFCDEYEAVLNRVRYEVAKSIPRPVRVHKVKFTTYSCGKCAHGVRAGDNFCSKCGTAIDWRQEA